MIQLLGLTLPLQGAQVRSLAGELRFHMLPGTVKKEKTHTPRKPSRQRAKDWSVGLEILVPGSASATKEMTESHVTQSPHLDSKGPPAPHLWSEGFLLEAILSKMFPLCFFLDKAMWLRVQAWNGNKPEFKSWFCPLTCYASLGRFFICEMDLIILVTKYFLGGPVAKTPSYKLGASSSIPGRGTRSHMPQLRVSTAKWVNIKKIVITS